MATPGARRRRSVTAADAAATIATDHPEVSVHAMVGDFEHHLSLRPAGGRRLVAFRDGTIGDRDPNEQDEWIEMRLVSEDAPTITIRDLGLVLEFTAGEEILTEISSEFREAPLTDELAGSGFALDAWWTDDADDFALSPNTAC